MGHVERQTSQRWLERYADSLGVPYENLMQHATLYVLDGTPYDDGYRFVGVEVDEDFWHHYQVATGRDVPESKQEDFFTCTC